MVYNLQTYFLFKLALLNSYFLLIDDIRIKEQNYSSNEFLNTSPPYSFRESFQQLCVHLPKPNIIVGGGKAVLESACVSARLTLLELQSLESISWTPFSGDDRSKQKDQNDLKENSNPISIEKLPSKKETELNHQQSLQICKIESLPLSHLINVCESFGHIDEDLSHFPVTAQKGPWPSEALCDWARRAIKEHRGSFFPSLS